MRAEGVLARSHPNPEENGWRKIAIALIDLAVGEQTAQAGENAFHEKAGRSQGDSFWDLLVTPFLRSRVATVATLPSA
ncbi:MAG: hypothetical protein ACRD23_17280, partial [Terriglobales bacterium]